MPTSSSSTSTSTSSLLGGANWGMTHPNTHIQTSNAGNQRSVSSSMMHGNSEIGVGGGVDGSSDPSSSILNSLSSIGTHHHRNDVMGGGLGKKKNIRDETTIPSSSSSLTSSNTNIIQQHHEDVNIKDSLQQLGQLGSLLKKHIHESSIHLYQHILPIFLSTNHQEKEGGGGKGRQMDYATFLMMSEPELFELGLNKESVFKLLEIQEEEVLSGVGMSFMNDDGNDNLGGMDFLLGDDEGLGSTSSSLLSSSLNSSSSSSVISSSLPTSEIDSQAIPESPLLTVLRYEIVKEMVSEMKLIEDELLKNVPRPKHVISSNNSNSTLNSNNTKLSLSSSSTDSSQDKGVSSNMSSSSSSLTTNVTTSTTTNNADDQKHHDDTAASYSSPTHISCQNTPPGFVFVCSADTADEALAAGVFGLPGSHADDLNDAIDENTPIFLFNFSDGTLSGAWVADGRPAMNIIPTAFSSPNRPTSRFPAQLRVKKATNFIENLQSPSSSSSSSFGYVNSNNTFQPYPHVVLQLDNETLSFTSKLAGHWSWFGVPGKISIEHTRAILDIMYQRDLSLKNKQNNNIPSSIHEKKNDYEKMNDKIHNDNEDDISSRSSSSSSDNDKIMQNKVQQSLNNYGSHNNGGCHIASCLFLDWALSSHEQNFNSYSDSDFLNFDLNSLHIKKNDENKQSKNVKNDSFDDDVENDIILPCYDETLLMKIVSQEFTELTSSSFINNSKINDYIKEASIKITTICKNSLEKFNTIKKNINLYEKQNGENDTCHFDIEMSSRLMEGFELIELFWTIKNFNKFENKSSSFVGLDLWPTKNTSSSSSDNNDMNDTATSATSLPISYYTYLSQSVYNDFHRAYLDQGYNQQLFHHCLFELIMNYETLAFSTRINVSQLYKNQNQNQNDNQLSPSFTTSSPFSLSNQSCFELMLSNEVLDVTNQYFEAKPCLICPMTYYMKQNNSSSSSSTSSSTSLSCLTDAFAFKYGSLFDSIDKYFGSNGSLIELFSNKHTIELSGGGSYLLNIPQCFTSHLSGVGSASGGSQDSASTIKPTALFPLRPFSKFAPMMRIINILGNALKISSVPLSFMLFLEVPSSSSNNNNNNASSKHQSIETVDLDVSLQPFLRKSLLISKNNRYDILSLPSRYSNYTSLTKHLNSHQESLFHQEFISQSQQSHPLISQESDTMVVILQNDAGARTWNPSDEVCVLILFFISF
mmetsp:Transcript_21054/g.27388  ORF Transcript_21054/g.27388 Transcript_21054/m.27388 type:complete len:1208 (+) Transcript_21054:2-3625(+)